MVFSIIYLILFRTSNDDLNPLRKAHQKFLRSQRDINLTSRLHAVLYDRCIDFFGAVEEDRQHRAGFEQPTITSHKRIIGIRRDG